MAKKPTTKKSGKSPTSEEAEDRLIEQGELTVHEMKDAMATMMEASTQMMQAFIDMRLSYLKVMRAGLEDPQATIDMMTKNARDLAASVKKNQRKK
ncbi:MAG TPA: hypothetical protein VLA52_03775 [Thermohalobaculum sp.]|nr:hypothetical protein [Thermohalobaculum sp.]